MERGKPRGAELVACVGGLALIASLLLPIEWFREVATGGIAGNGGGLAPDSVTALDALGAWVIPVLVGAAAPLLDLIARPVGKGIPWELRLVLVAVGLGVLLIGVVSELAYQSPPCCDLIYMQPQARIGFLLGGASAALLLFGTLASWPGRFPWDPRQTVERAG